VLVKGLSFFCLEFLQFFVVERTISLGNRLDFGEEVGGMKELCHVFSIIGLASSSQKLFIFHLDFQARVEANSIVVEIGK